MSGIVSGTPSITSYTHGPQDFFRHFLKSMRIAMRRIGVAALFWCSIATQACEYPDLGNLPLRRAVTRVKLLPETEAWSAYVHKTGVVVQYALLLEQTLEQSGRCYWTIEAIAEGKVWRRFYVTPDGTRVLDEERKPVAAPRAAKRSAAARAGAP
jgi:hypothetical protein